MSRLSNVSTLKIGIFRSWNTYWFDQTYYANVLFNDLKIKDYLSGIFYKLKIISNYFYVHRLLNNNILINTNLVLFSSIKFKSLNLRSIHKINPYFGFFYRKKHWFSFLRFLKMFNTFKKSHLPGLQNSLPQFYFNQYVTYYFLKVLVSYKNQSLFSILSFKLLVNQIYYSLRRFVASHVQVQVCPSNVSRVFHLLCNTIFNIAYGSKTYFLYTNPLEFDNYHFMYNDSWNTSNFLSDWFLFTTANNLSISTFLLCKFYYCYLFITNTAERLLFNMMQLSLVSYHPSMVSSASFAFCISDHLCITIPNFFLKRAISKSLFNNLRYQIESTISLYEQKQIYFNFSINLKQNPYLASAKIITDMLVYLLQSGQKIVKSFFFIRNWQSDCYMTRRTLEHLYNSKYSYCLKNTSIDISYLFHYATKQSPLIGIRIECSGTFKKGKMSKVYFYNSWVKDDTLTGRMPNTSMIADIDYYQYFAVSKSSSLGIKTWIFLETHIYNNNHKYISLVY